MVSLITSYKFFISQPSCELGMNVCKRILYDTNTVNRNISCVEFIYAHI